jgi:hypothetical protein
MVYKRTAPLLRDCLEPATWATNANKRLRAEFVDDWLISVRPAYFINRGALTRRYDEGEFNTLVAPFTHDHIPNVAVLLRKNYSTQGNTLVYDPGRESGRITYRGEGQ